MSGSNFILYPLDALVHTLPIHHTGGLPHQVLYFHLTRAEVQGSHPGLTCYAVSHLSSLLYASIYTPTSPNFTSNLLPRSGRHKFHKTSIDLTTAF